MRVYDDDVGGFFLLLLLPVCVDACVSSVWEERKCYFTHSKHAFTLTISIAIIFSPLLRVYRSFP